MSEREAVISEMRDIWYAVGEDLLTDESGNFDPAKVLKGTELAAIVSDLFAGGRCEDAALRDWYMAQEHEEREKIARAAFPDKNYGY
jgi:hypothetical protein